MYPRVRFSRFFLSCAFILTLLLILSTPMTAQGGTVEDAVTLSILSNPEVQAKWHAFSASGEEWLGAMGGYRPRLDLSAGISWEDLSGPGYEGRDMLDYTRDGVYLTLSQMLYDGNLTKSQVSKFGHLRKMRYFDLAASMERVALDAVRSHEDVIRYRTLVRMAQENFSRHEDFLKKVEDRTSAGVDSRVSLETMKGRLALAKVNLMTEENNLHDTITQFVRVVGETPSEPLERTTLDPKLPSSPESALEVAFNHNPQLFAMVENTLAMGSALTEQEAKMKPRLDLRAGVDLENDVDGTIGRRDKTWVELLLRYNIYNGGSDEAGIRRFRELQKESEENRRKAELDIRQAVLIAYNDVKAIEMQLPELDQHRRSADSMRKAYAQQFEVGRRNLLDLLDAENEYFQANRAYANADFNLVIAKARYLAATGSLVHYFGVARKDIPTPEQLGIAFENYTSGIADGE